MTTSSTAAAAKRQEAPTPDGRSTAALRLGFLVWDVSRLWRVVLDRALKPIGVTRSQYSVIAFLARRDGMTQTELAADLEVTKVAVGGLLERMEAVGLVERRSDQSDARVRRVYLSSKGSGILQTIREIAEPMMEQMLEPVGDEELDGTIQSLVTVKRRLLELGDASGAPVRLPKVAGRSSRILES